MIVGANTISRSGLTKADSPESVGWTGSPKSIGAGVGTVTAAGSEVPVGAIVWLGLDGALNSRVQKRQAPSSAVEVGAGMKVEVGIGVNVIRRAALKGVIMRVTIDNCQRN